MRKNGIEMAQSRKKAEFLLKKQQFHIILS